MTKFEYLVARGKEPSTWAGLMGLLAATGFVVPHQPELIAALVAVCGAVAVFLPEGK